MGVYIGLDIIPDKINKEEWKKVYNESLALIKAYPFAEHVLEEYHEEERYVLDRVKEKFENDNIAESRYWKTSGDLITKETGEGFMLYYDLNKYGSCYDNKNDDILLSFMGDEEGGVRVFNSKTQGKDYHIYLLAVACLIESRFPKYACVYANISKEQAEEAVKWANSILEKPINIPIRVDKENLVKRLKNLVEREKLIDTYEELIITDSTYELDKCLVENFSKEEIYLWFIKELQQYSPITQLGAEKSIIKFLNSNYSLEELCEICCLYENGPKFDEEKFINALAETYVFIPKECRGFMEIFQKPSHLAETVTYQFASIFLDMKCAGRHIKRYIPIEEALGIIKQKFKQNEKLTEILSNKVDNLMKNLEQEGQEINKKINKLEEMYNEKIIDDFSELIYYNKNSILSEDMVTALNAFKNMVNEGINAANESSKNFIKINSKVSIIKFLIKVSMNVHMVLTRTSWDYIENIEELGVLKKLVFIAALGNEEKLRPISRAFLENKDLLEIFFKQ